jgi:hypothetical protein
MNISYYATATIRMVPTPYLVYVVGREAICISMPVRQCFTAIGSRVAIRWRSGLFGDWRRQHYLIKTFA